LNFDSKPTQANLVQKIIQTTVYIAQGKYSKPIYLSLLGEENVAQLKNEANEGLLLFVKNFGQAINQTK
jgi:hypothetical protein